MLDRFVAAVRGLLTRRRAERELDDELRFHIEMETEANISRGMPPAEARRRALCDLGGLVQAAEAVRKVRAPMIEPIVRDVRMATRMLVRRPSFAAAAIVTLALGIGANTAIFSIVDATLIRRLPYPDEDRLVRLKGWSEQAFISWGGVDQFSPWPEELQTSGAFAAVGVAVPGLLTAGTGDAERVAAAAVTPGFFDVLGVRPTVGRVFEGNEATVTPDIAVISDRLWRRRFDADLGVAGRTMVLNGRRFIVTGVMPPRVSYPGATDVWVPSAALSEFPREAPAGVVLARLAAGVTPTQAGDVVVRILAAGARERSPGKAGRAPEVSLVSMRDQLVGPVRPTVILTAVSASLVLLVACLNTAQLLLTRVAARRREFAVRRAIGATRGQLTRQVLVESLLLSAAAGLVAIPAAGWTLDVLTMLLPPVLRSVGSIAIDGRVVAATAGISLCTAVLFGIVPAMSLPGQPDADLLRAVAGSSGDRFARYFRGAIVVAQIAASLMLLAGAATVLRTVSKLMQLDTGIRADHALAFDVMLPKASYPKEEVDRTFASLAEKLRSIPGVDAVGATSQLPGDPGPLLPWCQVAMDGRPVAADASRFAVRLAASPGYFAAAGIERVAGRDFNDLDRKDTPCVVVISEGLAKVIGASPAGMLGRRLDHGDVAYQKGCTVVGVVRDVLLDGPERVLQGRQYTNEATLRSAVYVPYEQYGVRVRDRHLVVRADIAPARLSPTIRAVVAQADSALPVYNMRTFDEIRAAGLADRRFTMTAFLAFALVATTLAALGLYSVLAHFVQQRTREIGIRVALGASPETVRRLILRNGIGLAVLGLAVGVSCTVALWRVVAARVPRLGEVDAATLVALGVTIVALAVVATWVPARRATRVDPVEALRAE